jgi:hypothetical protein
MKNWGRGKDVFSSLDRSFDDRTGISRICWNAILNSLDSFDSFIYVPNQPYDLKERQKAL